MKYWLKFFDNDHNVIISTSTISFAGDDLNTTELRNRFNTNFVKNIQCKCVEISFLGNGVNRSFVAGIKQSKVLIIDSQTKKEYTPKEFSAQLEILDKILAGIEESVQYLLQ
jgi:putative lipase involved disintegration of autophagic bodies